MSAPLLLLSSTVLVHLTSAKLIFVAAIWRHGDRAPKQLPYPTDPNGESAWPRGWNQLTNLGMQQTYELGKWLRKRYGKGKNAHIKEVFDRKEVLVMSSDSERALTSAQCVMAGLFPPDDEFVWKKKIEWQPTPIHTMGIGDDPLLKPTSSHCPRYNQVVKEENSGLLQSIDGDHQDLFRLLEKNSGVPVVNSSNIGDFYNVVRERIHGLRQPSWFTNDIVDRLIEIKRHLRTSEFNSPTKSRFRGGYLLGDWLRRINNAVNGVKNAMKTILYSAHDGTVSALMNVMQVANEHLVPYAACYVAELHRDNGQHFIKLFYKNDSHLEDPGKFAFQLTIPSCAKDCPLDQFNQIFSPIAINTTEEFKQICSFSV